MKKPKQPVQTARGMGIKGAMIAQMQQNMNKVIPRGNPVPMKRQPKKRGF